MSRIDTMVDGLIATRLATTADAGLRTSLTDLLGTVAIANAKLAYQRYLALAYRRVAAARGQGRASTTPPLGKHQYQEPTLSRCRYVEELIGRDTVNTMTPATLEAFRDHGQLAPALRTASRTRRTVSPRWSAPVSRLTR